MKYKLILFLLFIPACLNAGDRQDTTAVLSFDAFYRIVMANHPVVQQAGLLSEQAAENLRLARGGFDPKISTTWNMKEFSDTEYYNLLDVSLKVPLWFPLDPGVGIEQNRGTYLNPENYISESNEYRQVYYGITLPVGQGLFIDERRATVKQALILQEMAEAERVSAINKILLTAAKDYWEWFFAYRQYELMEQNIEIAEDIFDRTKMAFTYGEAAAIDTVQAKISLLTRVTSLRQATIDLAQAALRLSNHLWNEDGIPLEIPPGVEPENRPIQTLNAEMLQELTESARENHPAIRKLSLEGDRLEVDKRLAGENLKPVVDLSYYLLDQPWDASGEQNELAFDENYKVGLNIAFPLFLRKERGKLGQIKLKITEVELKQQFAEVEIINAINAQFVTLINLEDLLVQLEEVVENYELLLAAERLNLQNGESDLFKINIQLEKLIEARAKLIKARASYQKGLAELYWAAGISYLVL